MQRNGLMAHLVAGSLLLAGPLGAAEPSKAAAADHRPVYGAFGFDTAGMDRTVAPGDDFGRFASGTYLRNLAIPADRADSGMFALLRDLSQKQTRDIVEAQARVKGAPGSEAQKVGDFYASFMDEAAIEAKGLAPLKPTLDAIQAIGDRAQLAAYFGKATRQGMRMPLGLRIGQDMKNPDIMSVSVGQGGLGLPDREYYLDAKNPKFEAIRAKYLVHIATMLRLAGFDNPDARAKGILDLETKIAATHWTRVQQRQRDKVYNPSPAVDLEKAYPGVGWGPLLAAAGVGGEKVIIVSHPSAVAGEGLLMAREPLDTWKDYLAFHAVSGAASCLPKAFVEASFAFHGKVLAGQLEDQPRWKHGVDLTSRVLGEAVGKLYVAKHFPPEAKRQMDALVKNIIQAMDARLANLTWMDPATKAEARAKLARFTPKIGYPAKWRDYSALEIRRGDALGNLRRAAEFQYQRQLDKIGKPIDRSEWGMTPMTVNAYANPAWNEIVFPAAILQAPFFDAKADPAVNYGAIGVVIGHEISHHFDDQGRKFDKDGKLADWWTPEDVKRFTALTDQVVKQYAAYEPLPGTHVNGELTLGENLADLAGLNVAFDAYHASLGGKPAKVLGGFTGDQRFFLGFAQVWRSKYRDQALLNQVTTDPHTPGFLRPNVARNLDAWYRAFDVKEGQALFLAPKDRIKVW
ncbi:M13 family metallopeptidase [Mesoterricola silvestris]|uniref:Zinc metalloprotease n=1 Tax=Mesoterricola silvestris TaxID=2927979 RepID=A0AA48GQE1_9BACT|nr:M13 family metallopeptidase [Mesoterricola silvestris]BDU72285.1 zinc metalloprotease [Mesoterricola silvestris]